MLLNFQETKRILQRYGIPLVKTELVKEKAGLIKSAQKVGYPLVLKISSTQVLHRTNIGGVKIGLKNPEELQRAWSEIFVMSQKKHITLEGVLLQETMVGRQIIIGMKRDKSFGPVLMVGLGGIFVEILKDVSFRIAPIQNKEAEEMIQELKGYKILKGYRNQAGVAVDKIRDILIKLSRLSLKESQVKQIDFNPVFVDKKEAKVADAKIII